MELFGRTAITTDVDFITEENIVDVLRKARSTHQNNQAAIEYLYNYCRGKQPILDREKEVRPEICNKVCENRANEIVSFKVGYLCGEPIQYVSRKTDENVTAGVQALNDFLLSESKEAVDRELIEWNEICGTAYRLVLPNEDETAESPFEISTLDPRYAFVIYNNKVNKKPLAGVYFSKAKNTTTYSVYTNTEYFEIVSDKITVQTVNPLGLIPIIEYPTNNMRLGAFEIVVPLLDAINTVESNRLDGVEQFIQSLAIAVNCDFPEGTTANDIRQAGMLVLKSLNEHSADFKILAEQLDQTQTQTLINHLYTAVLEIVGMPNRNGGTSTSDTGAAVVYRDGWSSAETRAKDRESIFKKSERQMIKLILRICDDLSDEVVGLKVSDIDIKFTRRNFENITSKVNVLTSMLGNEKIAPRLAFATSGVFSDPEAAYAESVVYQKDQTEKTAQNSSNTVVNNESGAGTNGN